MSARPPSSICAGVALTLLLAIASPRLARAQACCGGASAVTPAWLAEGERALVGVQLRASRSFGAYPAAGPFFAAPPGYEVRMESVLFGSLRLLPRTQASVSLPLPATYRDRSATSELGAGVGDLTLAVRYDLVRAGESPVLPGVGVVPSLSVPTGKPSDATRTLLATDVTGTGAWEPGVALVLERAFGHVALHATASAAWRAPRDVFGLRQQLGPRGLVLVGAGWVFESQTAAWLSVAYTFEADARVDGAAAPGTGRRGTQVSLIVMQPLGDDFRLRGALFTDLPAGPLGDNQIASLGLSTALTRSFR